MPEANPIRDAIFKLGEQAPEPLTAAGWPEGTHVRKIAAGEHEEIDRAATAAKQTYGVPYPDNAQAMLLVRALCDADGKRLFTNADVGALGKLPQDLIGPAFAQAAKFNGLDGDEAVEEAAKNSDSGPGSDSSSTSPDISGEASPS